MDARKCKVRKGLETPLHIMGMRVGDFYWFICLSALYVFAVIGVTVAAISGQLGGAVIIEILLGGSIALLTALMLFKRKARGKKYKLQNKISSLSNHDILHYL